MSRDNRSPDVTGDSRIAETIRHFLSNQKKMLIDNEWHPSQSGETFTVDCPSSGETIAIASLADESDVEAAVSAARKAFDSAVWRSVTPAGRTKLLWKLAELIEANTKELAYLEALNQGKSIVLAENLDVGGSIEILRYYAGWCTKIEGGTVPVSCVDERDQGAQGPAYHAYYVREPIGVVGAIVPWNVPLQMAVAKLAPALAAGCTVVLKPAEETPLTTLRLGELIVEAGFPPGVVNIISGTGEGAGNAIALHPGIDKIVFTGSTETGKKIISASTVNLKKVSLELGGKSPVFIFADANIEKAIEAAAQSIFVNCGQMCFAGSRLYVQKQVLDQVVSGITKIAEKLKLGPGIDPASDLGPLISQKQLDRVCRYIESGVADGVDLRTGGGRVNSPGYFVEPTVMVSEHTNIPLIREEIFGPVLVIIPFDDEISLKVAASMANDTDYGLTASVWTKDISRAHILASEIRAGTIWINCTMAFDDALPFGGYKQSGWGREGGRLGVEEFTEVKSVVIGL